MVRFGLILFSMAFLVLTVRETATTVGLANMSVIAMMLEKDRKISDKNLDSVIADAGSVRERGICRTELVSAATTVLLHKMDRNSPGRDFDLWSAAVRDTEAHLRFTLGCVPGDSNAWLRYAALRSVIAENPAEVAGLMHMSRQLDPADGHMLFARLGFWSSFTEQTLKLAEPDVIADLATLLQWGERCSVGREIRQLPPAMQPYVEKARKQVPAEKLQRFDLKCFEETKIEGPFKL
jgi:hypothetical protein